MLNNVNCYKVLGLREECSVMLTIDNIEKKSKEVFALYPIKKVTLFGSYAKGEQTEDSDIDMLVKESDLSLLTLSRIKQELTEVFNKKVDLMGESDISDIFKFLIRDEEVVIYEKQG